MINPWAADSRGIRVDHEGGGLSITKEEGSTTKEEGLRARPNRVAL
jgi:hypothetical protein